MKIVWCIDKNFMEYAKISIASYREHNPRAEIIVVSEKPIPNEIGYDKNIVIKLKRKFRKRGFFDRISKTAYIKCFLTQLPYRKVIYVDADTVCQKPLEKLWKMPCKYINICESHRFGKEQAKALGLKKYGLSGVMVMNLTALRKINFTKKCEYVEKNLPTPSTGWQHDETCINVALAGKLKFINKKYDYCHNRAYDKPIKEENAYIVHYIGDDKKEMITGENYREIWPVRASVENKKVAIVGNAQSLFDRKYGKEIDKHDFIIRFNKGFITKPESQGTKTSFLILATHLKNRQIKSYKAEYTADRCKVYNNKVQFIIGDKEKRRIRNFIGEHPTTGFIAIDICLCFGAKSIDLYGFDFEATPTFYNPKDYVSPHDYKSEKKIVEEYERLGILKIHR